MARNKVNLKMQCMQKLDSLAAFGQRKNDKDEIKRIERFFRSRYFSFYSDLDGEDVLRRLKKYEDNS